MTGSKINVLLVGSGGREHALAWKLAQSPLLDRLLIAPGNPGTAQIGQNMPVASDATAQLVELARREQVGLVVVGPEDPLAAGLADACADAGLAVFGPSAAAAQIESSKIFARQLMQRAGVAGPEAHSFARPADAIAFVRASGAPWVIKADGLAAGKGVVVADDVEASVDAIEQIMGTSAGQRVLLEQRLAGPEVSVLALCDGTTLLPLPPARDHKRLGDGDTGPNTGGMGAYAPVALGPGVLDTIVNQMMYPVVRELAADGTPFRGVLYAGVMLTEHGPRILEFNARFGDPEAQVILPLLEGDLLAALLACAEGRLDLAMLAARPSAAVGVVLAAAGYPKAPRRGDPITGVDAPHTPDVLVFQAGTDRQDGTLVTSGGRVLCVTALAPTHAAARHAAYAAVATIGFAGAQYRHDIGARAAD